MNFNNFYQAAKVYKEDVNMYVVTDGDTEMVVDINFHLNTHTTCFKILSHEFTESQAENIFKLVEEYIEENREPTENEIWDNYNELRASAYIYYGKY